MLVNSATADALDYIAERAADAANAFAPGARASFDDVAVSKAPSRTVLDPLSVMPPQDGYFITSDDRGRTAYTQNGAFSIVDGAIAGSNGRAITGFTCPDGTLHELRIDPVDAALKRATDVVVAPDGSVSYTRASFDPRSGTRKNERVVVGTVALARFPSATKLSAADAERSLPPPGVVPHVGRPEDGDFGALAPMQRGGSHIDLERSLNKLSDAYLAFDALAAAHKAQGAAGKTAMDLLK